jgi:hypothetical protein
VGLVQCLFGGNDIGLPQVKAGIHDVSGMIVNRAAILKSQNEFPQFQVGTIETLLVMLGDGHGFLLRLSSSRMAALAR